MKKLRSGQSILEVVIATTMISIAIIAALSLANQSQKSTNYSKLLDQATAYNNQAADYLRNQKTLLGWGAFVEKITNDAIGNETSYCLSSIPDSTTDTFTTLSPGICGDTNYISNTIFRRQLTINATQISTGTIPLTITTNWPDSQERSATLTLELTQWN